MFYEDLIKDTTCKLMVKPDQRDRFKLLWFDSTPCLEAWLEPGSQWYTYRLKLREFIPYTQRREEIADLVGHLSEP